MKTKKFAFFSTMKKHAKMLLGGAVLSIALFTSNWLVCADVFHAVILGDTKDLRIGESCRADIRHLKKGLLAISQQIGTELSLSVIEGNHFSQRSVKKWVRRTNASETDIVFFYLTGHGKMGPKDSPWPCAKIHGKDTSMADIKKSLSSCRARLIIILFDCCNACDRGIHPLTIDQNLPGLVNLFRNSKGTILACAASQREFAIGINQGFIQGGIFTTGLFLALNDLCKSPIASWESVLSLAQRYSIEKSRGGQHPIFSIEPFNP